MKLVIDTHYIYSRLFITDYNSHMYDNIVDLTIKVQYLHRSAWCHQWEPVSARSSGREIY